MPPRKRPLDPAVIRVGDAVRVTVPRIVTRVGYPRAVEDYLPEVERLFLPALAAPLREARLHLGEPRREKFVRELAYLLARRDGFGGRERTLHLQDAPELLAVRCFVSAVRSVYTGTYYPPHGSWDDWDPGGLDNRRCRRLLDVYTWEPEYRTFEVPVEHVVKLENPRGAGGT